MLSKAYNPLETEDKIYRFWQKTGFFNPDNLPKHHKIPYIIVIPPPNITGELHMGHALNAIIQDILIRWRRLQGYKALWVPGTDHAGIATQNMVEKTLRKEGLTRFDLGREKFIKRVWEWKKKYGNIILNQFKKIGCSLDWSRERFTLDKNYSKAVKFAFLSYYKKGWIYQKERVINWCPRCQTSLSDLELNYKEEKGKLWYIKYPLKSNQGIEEKYIVVATTRPETMLGDTAVAMNPKDKRYKKFINKKVILPIQNREIPIIADKSVDPHFGTGVVKVTPAHDFTDWEIGRNHNLKLIKIINEGGLMTKESGVCAGMKPLDCRKKVIELLEKENLIEKIEDYNHSLPYCDRCHSLIEPLPSLQWFLKMDTLAKKAIKAVKEKKLNFHPRKWEKIYFNWLRNIKDWCISRQIWWGHKIPIRGANDVLDTWFSSALWPFAVFGWPKKTRNLRVFYPTDTLSTGRDIINLWVARMVFSGLEFTKKVPFKDVYIHPTVLTKEGKRMSKSLGIGVNPLDLLSKYGADATRFGIAWQIMKGQDIHFTEDNIIMGRKFCNKIWNASRFVLMKAEGLEFKNLKRTTIKKFKLTNNDKKILKLLDNTVKLVNRNLEKFQFGKVARIIYKFFWHEFCDKYIEYSKSEIKKARNRKEKEKSLILLLYILLNSLKILHPFMPFVTEEIYQKFPIKNRKKSLMIEDWPK